MRTYFLLCQGCEAKILGDPLSKVATAKMTDILSNPLVRLVRQLIYVQLTRRRKNCVSIPVNNSEANPVWFLQIKFDTAMRGDFCYKPFNSALLREKLLVVHRLMHLTLVAVS
jgi:hypothetical protein